MRIEVSDLGESVRKVALVGRLDTSGVLGIETSFVTALVPHGKHAVVDLSKVEFIGSMGLRMFISVARTMRDKQMKLVFYAPQPLVNNVLETAAFARIAPVCVDAAQAVAATQA